MIAIVKDNTSGWIFIGFGIFMAVCVVGYGIITIRRWKIIKKRYAAIDE